MSVIAQIKAVTAKAISIIYNFELEDTAILVNGTKPEFEGDYTVVLFAFVKQLKKSPDVLGQELGEYLVANNPTLFTDFNVIKGFLNLSIADSYWVNFTNINYHNANYGKATANGKKVMVEYSSPNTNKPLHLGHLRNNFLGWSIAEILKANGYDVVKTCIVNDRGIHICKSMVAWQMDGYNKTPENTQRKGDHLVGDFYVDFETKNKLQTAEYLERFLRTKDSSVFSFDAAARYKTEELLVKIEALKEGTEEYKKVMGELVEVVKNNTTIMIWARQMLIDWEAGKPDVIALWQKMNTWVYDGFAITYKTIGSDFDKVYYESNTYLLGKDLVEQGLEKNVFTQKEDSSVWIDLTNDGLDEKIVRRKDGTSVYITQDIGLAEQKQKEFDAQQSIYVVGDEQNYHFKVLKLICQKLGLPSADGIFHLSYGMVELPTGKMKSREGTVVDADELVDEMIAISQQKTEELGKVKDFTTDELAALYNTIGLGALKFFLLRVDPKKKMVFNPEESIDFHGFTGPFIQYTYARIKSILRKMEVQVSDPDNIHNSQFIIHNSTLLSLEKSLCIALEQFPIVISDAAAEHDPSKVAIYIFTVAKTFNSFYTEHSIANAETEEKKILRLQLSQLTAQVLKTGMQLLGIGVPERM